MLDIGLEDLLRQNVSDSCSLTIKDNGNLFQSPTTRFREEKIDDNDFNGNPNVIVDVIFPLGVFKSNRLLQKG